MLLEEEYANQVTESTEMTAPVMTEAESAAGTASA
jgi:hypothetical protein